MNMKKKISLCLLLSLFILRTYAQEYDWTKDDRNNIYNECMNYISKYKNLTNEQKESISICYLDEITKKYSKKEYHNKIDIELKKIRETSLILCSKNLGIELIEFKVEDSFKVTPQKELTSLNPTKEMLIGHWKDENSEFWLFESGDFKIQYTNGKIAKGTWNIDVDQLIFFKDKLFWKTENIFKVLIFTNERFVYQSVNKRKDTYTANRIK